MRCDAGDDGKPEESRLVLRNRGTGGMQPSLQLTKEASDPKESGKAHKKVENTRWSSSQVLQDGTVTRKLTEGDSRNFVLQRERDGRPVGTQQRMLRP
jgi:hypothetical protein